MIGRVAPAHAVTTEFTTTLDIPLIILQILSQPIIAIVSKARILIVKSVFQLAPHETLGRGQALRRTR